MKKITTRQIVTILVTLLTIVLNILANALPFNGQNTGEISDRFDVLFVPAGYVFLIWFFIYVGMAAFTIYQALPAQADNALLNRIAPAYWIANMANNVWLFLWHWEQFPLTLAAMTIILISLITLYLQFGSTRNAMTRTEKWLVKLPFSIYLGWISVATIANVSQVLFFTGWGGWGLSAQIWTVVMLLVATTVGLLMLLRKFDYAYALVLVWSFAGIAVKQASNDLAVTRTAILGAALLLVVSLFTIISKMKLQKEK